MRVRSPRLGCLHPSPASLQLLPAPGHFLVRVLDATNTPIAAIDVFNGAQEVPEIDVAVLRMRTGPSWLVWVRCLNNIAAAHTSSSRAAAAAWLSAAIFFLSVGPLRAPFPATPDLGADSGSVELLCFAAACAGAARILRPHLLEDFETPQRDVRVRRLLVGLARHFYGLRRNQAAATELIQRLRAAAVARGVDVPAAMSGTGGSGGETALAVLAAVQFLASATLDSTAREVAADARTQPWFCRGADELPLYPCRSGLEGMMCRLAFDMGQSPCVWRGIDDALRRGAVRSPPSLAPAAGSSRPVVRGAGGGLLADSEDPEGGAAEIDWDDKPDLTRGLEACDGEPLRALAWLFDWPAVSAQLCKFDVSASVAASGE